MRCCNKNPVIVLQSGQKLCKSHFCKYFEKKLMRTIRRFRLLGKKEHLGIALSGGKDSSSLLFALKKIFKNNKGIKISAILIDEGINGYRNKTKRRAEKLCKKLDVPLHVYSFRKEFGHSLDGILQKLKSNPCTECGILRRYLINKAARSLKVTKLATGHNLDDEAQAILMNQFRKNTALQARLGPITGISSSDMFVPRVKPFYLLSEKEVALYAYLNGLYSEYETCPYEHDSFRAVVRDKLNEIENTSQGTKNNIVASFLEIHPLLQRKYKGKGIPICSNCGEPSSGNICNACKLIGRIN
ncbi:MAG TPA: TIGR00269 family protein [Candidatus Nanoarchaeia archaeon]|nr:TIGR00269 family protein [Candidatus Nanoarchaeia archaeon]